MKKAIISILSAITRNNTAKLVLSLALLFGSSEFISSSSDFELWMQLASGKAIKEKWAVSGTFEIRLRNDASDPYLYYLQAFVDRRLSKTWTFQPSYRQDYVRTRSGSWKFQSVPIIAMIAKIDLDPFYINSRSRFEYRSLSGNWVFREQVIVKFPEIRPLLKLRPTTF